MQFFLKARDYRNGGLERREKAIERHWRNCDEMRAGGEFLFGASLLDENNKMRCSIMVFDFPSRKELDEYLKREPFVVDKVWENYEITPCKVRDVFLKQDRA